MRRERPHARLRIHAGCAPKTLQRFAEVVAVPDGESRRSDIEARRHRLLPFRRCYCFGPPPLMMARSPNRRQCVARATPVAATIYAGIDAISRGRATILSPHPEEPPKAASRRMAARADLQ